MPPRQQRDSSMDKLFNKKESIVPAAATSPMKGKMCPKKTIKPEATKSMKAKEAEKRHAQKKHFKDIGLNSHIQLQSMSLCQPTAKQTK